MIDDMQGLFSHASEAYRAGKTEGMDDFYRFAMSRLSRLSVDAEKQDDAAAFHAIEACCTTLRDLKGEMGKPKTERAPIVPPTIDDRTPF